MSKRVLGIGIVLISLILLLFWLWPSDKESTKVASIQTRTSKKPMTPQRYTSQPQGETDTPSTRAESIAKTLALDKYARPVRTLGLYPRDPQESQRWRLDTQFTMRCETTIDCCAAKACVKGICTGCSSSDDCLSGESCVIDHCIPSENSQCNTRHDCESGQLCVLQRSNPPARRGSFQSGADCRNNSTYSSSCQLSRMVTQ